MTKIVGAILFLFEITERDMGKIHVETEFGQFLTPLPPENWKKINHTFSQKNFILYFSSQTFLKYFVDCFKLS